MSTPYYHRLKELPLFSKAKDETIQQFIEMSRLVTYKKNNYVFYDQEDLTSVFIVLTGKLSIYKMSENGQNRIIYILSDGQLLNDDVTQDFSSAINCHVFEEAQIFVCTKTRFIKLMEQDYGFMQGVLEQYTSKLRRTYRQLKNAPANISIEKKVAAKLVKLSYDYGQPHEEGTLINLSLSVTYLADMLSTQRETVSRAIKKLSDQNLISYSNKQLIVYDVKALSDYFKQKTK